MKNIKAILIFITILVVFSAGAVLAEKSNKSEASGPRSCSATSEDKAQSCSVSCKENENALCSNTKTEATCLCQ